MTPHLNERQRRILYGAKARQLGHCGIAAVARAAGVSKGCVSRGLAELDADAEPDGRVRRPGAGRPALADRDPGLVPALLELVEDSRQGDPMKPLTWTTKSLRRLARRTAPFSFLGAASYSATIRSLYSRLKVRRFGRGADRTRRGCCWS
ncbi:hypothetical protein [Streptomyces sp. NPDC090994]|uniref:hypothetical protein n=1 Tax=Streptomyces sp. NPDC090994 TaxID=3365969 RepID=UPI00380F5F79